MLEMNIDIKARTINTIFVNGDEQFTISMNIVTKETT